MLIDWIVLKRWRKNGIYEFEGEQYYAHWENGTCELLDNGTFSGQVDEELRFKIARYGNFIREC